MNEHSGDISCSVLVDPSHTDESWEGRNTCIWIYMYIYIYIYMYVCMYVCMCAYVYIYNILMYIYIYIIYNMYIKHIKQKNTKI